MLYFSEITNKTYKTVKELEEAEKAVNEEKVIREKADKEIKAAEKAVAKAYDAYQEAIARKNELIEDYIRKYGSYKTTAKMLYNDEDDIFNKLFFGKF